jgi:hypothetical protein
MFEAEVGGEGEVEVGVGVEVEVEVGGEVEVEVRVARPLSPRVAPTRATGYRRRRS